MAHCGTGDVGLATYYRALMGTREKHERPAGGLRTRPSPCALVSTSHRIRDVIVNDMSRKLV